MRCLWRHESVGVLSRDGGDDVKHDEVPVSRPDPDRVPDRQDGRDARQVHVAVVLLRTRRREQIRIPFQSDTAKQEKRASSHFRFSQKNGPGSIWHFLGNTGSFQVVPETSKQRCLVLSGPNLEWPGTTPTL